MTNISKEDVAMLACDLGALAFIADESDLPEIYQSTPRKAQSLILAQSARIEELEAEVGKRRSDYTRMYKALILAANRLDWCAGVIPNDDARDKAGGFAADAREALITEQEPPQ